MPDEIVVQNGPCHQEVNKNSESRLRSQQVEINKYMNKIYTVGCQIIILTLFF